MARQGVQGINVSVELKIIIHLEVSVIVQMSSVTIYFSVLNTHFSGVTMDLRKSATIVGLYRLCRYAHDG